MRTTITSLLLLIGQIAFTQSDTLRFAQLYFSTGCIEIPPHYPGGHKAIQKLFSENIKFPKSLLRQKIPATIKVSFQVDTFGNTTHIQIIKHFNQDLDNEVIRLVLLLKGWRPATSNGKKLFTICLSL